MHELGDRGELFSGQLVDLSLKLDNARELSGRTFLGRDIEHVFDYAEVL